MKYFLHDTSSFDDEKITELYLKFGYEGLGLFYTLLEKIARQEKPIKTEVLKSQLHVGKKLEKCWKFMEEIGLVSSSNGDTFNERLLNFSETYEIKKEKTRKRVAEWREKQRDIENVTCYSGVSNAPKVKLSKVKESKGTKENSFFNLELPFKDENFKKTLTEFSDHCTEKYKRFTIPGLTKFLVHIKKVSNNNSNTAIEMMNTSMRKGYTDVFPDNGKQGKFPSKEPPPTISAFKRFGITACPEGHEVQYLRVTSESKKHVDYFCKLCNKEYNA